MNEKDQQQLEIGKRTPSANTNGNRSLLGGWKGRWDGEIDTKLATLPLVGYCFMTGYVDAVAFSACFIWVAFQTGNTIQLAIAIARLCSGPSPRPQNFRTADGQALTALLGFLFGSFAGRIGDRIGAKRRSWLILATIAQSLLTLAAALAIRSSSVAGPIAGMGGSREGDAWTDALGFVALAFSAASMGLQSLVAKRLNTTINTSVVLTTIWTELVAEPSLFKWGRQPARDDRAIAIAGLFVGGFVGRAVTAASNSAVAFGVGAGLRLMLAVAWLAVPEPRTKARDS